MTGARPESEGAEGALVATAAGNAFGWPQEFPAKVRGPNASRSPALVVRRRRGGGPFSPYEQKIANGT